MGLNQPVKRTYLTVGYGKLRIKCDESTPGGVKRDNDKGTSYALEYSSIDGILADVTFKEDNEFGNEWRPSIQDGEDTYVIQIKENSQYCRDFLKKLPNLVKGQTYKFTPFDFQDTKKDKRRIGLSIKDANDVKVHSFYQKDVEGKEYPENTNGFPEYAGKWTDKEEVKIYGIRVTSFLRNKGLAFLQHEFIRNAVEPVTQPLPEARDESLPPDDLPF